MSQSELGQGQLGGRVALVTGGAGGIGAAICSALAQAGAAVMVGFSGQQERAQALAAQLPGHGHRALLTRVDDSDDSQRRRRESQHD